MDELQESPEHRSGAYLKVREHRSARADAADRRARESRLTYDQYSRIASVNYPQAQSGGQTMRLTQLTRDSLQRLVGSTFSFSDGTAYSETLTRNQQRSLVTTYRATYNGHTAGADYSYDKAGRMTSATVDGTQYQYSFGTQDASCAILPGYNPNASKNSNRTSYTITDNGTPTTTTACYNMADQLITSSDTQIGTPTYDDHGNTTQLAGNGTPISFSYDASDYNTTITQGDNKVEYLKSASGTILQKKEYRNGTLDKIYRYASGVLIICDTTNPTSCSIADKYLSLPGGVSLTLKASGNVYSVKNFHGDTAITTDATGKPNSSVYLYDPFGQTATSATFATSTAPANATDTGMGWAASPTRKQETLFTLPIIQNGRARNMGQDARRLGSGKLFADGSL